MAEKMIGLEIRGLKEFRQALNRADKELAKDVYNRLRKIAGITGAEARQLAAARTERRTGDLIDKIRPFAVLKGAGVRSSATHRGYPYPRRLEFEGRGGGETGPRASLYPAYVKTLPLVIAAGEQMLRDLERELSR